LYRQQSNSVQVEAEQAARDAAKEGLGRKLRDAEACAEALAETVEEMRAGMDRQRAAADYRSVDNASLGSMGPKSAFTEFDDKTCPSAMRHH